MHKKRYRVLFYLGACFLLLCFLLFWFTPSVYKLAQQQSLLQTRWDAKLGKHAKKVGPNEKDWISLKSLSLHAIHAIVVAEDARFYQHNGLDFVEIAHSLELNWEQGRFVRGASTITQQLVRMVFLSHKKSLWRKTREAWGAILLELILSKEEIVEWYINLVPLGVGVYGLKEAAKEYFSVNPELLTINQAIQLALILPSPNRSSRMLRYKFLDPYGQKRFSQILLQMLNNSYITQTQWQLAMGTGNFGSPIVAFK